jgi:hypothetical protein
VDARPLAGSDHGVARGRLDLQRLARFPFLPIFLSGLHLEFRAISLGRERVPRARMAFDLPEESATDQKMSPVSGKELGIAEVG